MQLGPGQKWHYSLPATSSKTGLNTQTTTTENYFLLCASSISLATKDKVQQRTTTITSSIGNITYDKRLVLFNLKKRQMRGEFGNYQIHEKGYKGCDSKLFSMATEDKVRSNNLKL